MLNRLLGEGWSSGVASTAASDLAIAASRSRRFPCRSHRLLKRFPRLFNNPLGQGEPLALPALLPPIRQSQLQILHISGLHISAAFISNTGIFALLTCAVRSKLQYFSLNPHTSYAHSECRYTLNLGLGNDSELIHAIPQTFFIP